jgi:hypothetical protein
VYEFFYLSSFFYVISVSVRTMSGKRKRVVVSLDMKFHVIRVFDCARFSRSTLPRTIGTRLYIKTDVINTEQLVVQLLIISIT